MLCVLFLSHGVSNTTFYWLLLIVGLPNGYWSVFMASASEQFGTNIRATVTTSAPNFVRGMVVVLSTLFSYLSNEAGMGFVSAASLIGAMVTVSYTHLDVYKRQILKMLLCWRYVRHKIQQAQCLVKKAWKRSVT